MESEGNNFMNTTEAFSSMQESFVTRAQKTCSSV
jgi:hypothetical protein